MTGFEIVILALLALITLEQVFAVGFFLIYCRRRQQLMPDNELPEALVVLALRGLDPPLSDCLRALFTQDYPRYRVRVMVDNRQDPAWEVVEQTIRELKVDHVEVRALEEPSDRCTLKCTALLQATADLDPSTEVVAFLDADVAPHRTWLRELVNPLSETCVGAAMGNRWYAPRVGYWGSLVRVIWNVGAVVNMYYWRVPWGGTLAVRADILRQSDLRARWSKAGCDDVPLFAVLRKLRLKLVFVPELLLVNREDTRVSNCLRFIWRQMLWVRLYHPVCWWVCTVFHYLTLGAPLLGVGLLAIAVWTGRWFAAGPLAGMIVLNYLGTFVLIALAELQARNVLASRGGGNSVSWIKLASALGLTHVVTALAMLYSLLIREVEWRGIRYRVRGPWQIRMLEYRPITATRSEGSGTARTDKIVTVPDSNQTE